MLGGCYQNINVIFLPNRSTNMSSSEGKGTAISLSDFLLQMIVCSRHADLPFRTKSVWMISKYSVLELYRNLKEKFS